MMFRAASIFDNWGEEVRAKWQCICPTDEQRFIFLYCEEEGNRLKANELWEWLGEMAFEEFGEDLKRKYSHLLPPKGYPIQRSR